jgi:hypothetical protein
LAWRRWFDNNFLGLFESPIVTLLFALTFVSLCWPFVGPVLKLAFSRFQGEGN